MITIIADPHHYHADSVAALKADSLNTYVDVRRKIRYALDQGQDITIHVTDRLLLHWLSDLAHYEGVTWQQIAPESDYRRLFRKEPIPLLTPDLLIAIDIATLGAPPPTLESDPIGWILSERLHPLWGVPTGSPTHLVQLIGWILQNPNMIANYLYPLIQDRLQTWAYDDSDYAILQVGSLITDATNIIRRTALQHYDLTWLHEQGLGEFPVLRATIDKALAIQSLTNLAPAIERYWNEYQPWTAETLQTAMECMSGWSYTELQIIEKMVKRDIKFLDLSLIQRLRRRFADLPKGAIVLDELETLVPPPLPPLPKEEWNDEQWIRWATDTYMPYFMWTVHTEQPRDYQQTCAQAYETWLAQRYPHWLMSTSSPLLTTQFTQMRDLIDSQPNSVVVWLVIDGMTWWQGRMLKDICRHQGLQPHRYESGIAMLPSLTTISKRALVTGVPVTEPPRGGIAQAAREKFERVGIRGFVGYDVRDILQALHNAEPPQCLLWFYNKLDQLAHEQTTLTNDAIIRGVLEDLGRNLNQMRIICTEHGLNFNVLIGSDHGSTLLPSHAPTHRLPSLAHEVIDVWEDIDNPQTTQATSSRAAVINGDYQSQMGSSGSWHYLAHLQYQLPQDYLIPKGYAAIGRRPTGWTHGGLSPEETIVPLMHLTSEPLTIQNLRLIIQGNVRPRQKSSLTLQLTNPNIAPFNNVTIHIADLATISIEYIAAQERYETTVIFPSRVIDGDDLSLVWELEGYVLGIEHRQQGEARIPVRRLQTEGSFDDLFG